MTLQNANQDDQPWSIAHAHYSGLPESPVSVNHTELMAPQANEGLKPQVNGVPKAGSFTASNKIKKITCLGSGFVGGPTSAVTAIMSDVKVTVVDIDQERITAWKSMTLPIYEPGLDELVYAARDGVEPGVNITTCDSSTPSSKIEGKKRKIRLPSLFFSIDIDGAIAEADLIFLCVNTPTKLMGVGKGAGADLRFVEAATRMIARVATRSKIVVEKSTVPCRTAHSIREILSANAHPGVQFDVLSNPEFLAEGTAVKDLLSPDRIIIGSMQTPSGHRAAALLADVYAQWVPRDRIVTMNLWSAELSKLAANAMLAQRISSVNALSAICEETGANVEEVSYACGLDSRIGPGMLKAGPGFGGSCFQKDINNILYLSESLHLYEVADYWRAIVSLNEYQKQRFTKRIISCLFNNLGNKKIAVLGFAFKKNTSDTRESPAITLVSNFVAEGAHVAIYDPKVKEKQILTDLVNHAGDIQKLKLQVEICSSAYIACHDADAVVVVTEWDEFSNKEGANAAKESSIVKTLSEKTANPVAKPMPVGPTKDSSGQITSAGLSSSETTKFRRKQQDDFDEQQAGLILHGDQEPRISLDWARIAGAMRKPRVVFDGRGILDAEKLEELGFRVEVIDHLKQTFTFESRFD